MNSDLSGLRVRDIGEQGLLERLQRLNNPTYIGVLNKSITQKKPNNNSSSTSSSSICSVCPPGYNSSCSELDFGPVGGTYMQCNGTSGTIEIPLVPPDPIY